VKKRKILASALYRRVRPRSKSEISPESEKQQLPKAAASSTFKDCQNLIKFRALANFDQELSLKLRVSSFFSNSQQQKNVLLMSRRRTDSPTPGHQQMFEFF